MKVAIITPYYKEDIGIIRRCHDSVLNQTHKDITHIIVSDGFPKEEIDSWNCIHVKIPPCGDYGDTPRGIGAAIAAAQGFDAISFIDCDCWAEKEHIEQMVKMAQMTSVPVITCPRNLMREDGSFMKVDAESNGRDFNDTNCYMFTKKSFEYLRAWILKPKELAIVGDRILWGMIVNNKILCAHVEKPTLNYTTSFALHYVNNGETPPDNSKITINENGKKKMISYKQLKEIMNEQKQTDKGRAEKALEEQKLNAEQAREKVKDEISVVCWMWKGDDLSYSFKPEYVNKLASMVKRNLTLPHKFICITDEPSSDFSDDVIVMPTPKSALPFTVIKTPEGKMKPSCYRRLWMFSEEAKKLGNKILSIDVDFVITGNIDHLFNYDSDFVGWQNPSSDAWGTNFYIGCIWLHKTGTKTHIWDNFISNPQKAIQDARTAGFRGSDQAWISYNLWGKEALFKKSDGLYSINDNGSNIVDMIFDDTKLVQFNGYIKPWDMNYEWIKNNWK